jgi:hypothetical protein
MPLIKLTMPIPAPVPIHEEPHHEELHHEEPHHEEPHHEEPHHEEPHKDEEPHHEEPITTESFLNGICSALLEVITANSDITTEQIVAFFNENMTTNGITMLTASQMKAQANHGQSKPLALISGAKTKIFSEKQKECQQHFASGAKARGTEWATANKDWWKAVGQKLEKKAGSTTTLSGWHAYQMFGGDQSRVTNPDPVTGIISRPKK